ncbi:MAG: cytochrome c oxidase subunit II [Pseudomonadota bacterium]|nr:cytochrome c oxidase subunit II [Pseudomonadota bacterium]
MSLLPAAASTLAPRVDALFYVVLAVTGVVAVAIGGLIIVLSIRYRAGSNTTRESPGPQRESKVRRWLEIGWIATPLALFLGAFAWGSQLYIVRSTAPSDAMEIDVVAKQWIWKAQHRSGQREINELHVPRGMPVKLLMTSQDVIHSFFVPAFRVKQDVLPGRYTMLWFNATQNGEFHLFCTEYCGTDHSRMGGSIIVMDPPQFAAWLRDQGQTSSMSARGSALFRELGCSGCHGANASVHAPSLDGLYGRPVPLADGRVVTADERYLRDSILLPQKEVAAGYEPIMPSFAGQIDEDDLLDLIAYIKSLAPPAGASR